MIKYRWDTPHDWLSAKVQGWDANALRGALNSLIPNLTSEQIEDTFDPDMSEDGYYIPEGAPLLVPPED